MQVLRDDRTGEMELSGTAIELQDLVKALRSEGCACELDVQADPSPYSGALNAIESTRSSGNVVISASAERQILRIQGGVKELEALASVIDEFAKEGDPSLHLHIEYLPGHEFLSPHSEPIVLALIV